MAKIRHTNAEIRGRGFTDNKGISVLHIQAVMANIGAHRIEVASNIAQHY